MPIVYVVGGDHLVEGMFRSMGWEVRNTIKGPIDLVCFTGGEDVSPALYGEKRHNTTGSNWGRDAWEITQYEYCLNRNIPMIGICRGGQFLNVMCGGKLWQDVDDHAIRGTHAAKRLDTPESTTVNVTSTHHQMMRPGPSSVILLEADHVGEVRSPYSTAYQIGVEAVLYPWHKSLCFQPHPEYGTVSKETKELFFEYIHKYFKMKVGE
jgi:gamma-glutamyl-gamma-aminobutyrate hydrolase PuuD